MFLKKSNYLDLVYLKTWEFFVFVEFSIKKFTNVFYIFFSKYYYITGQALFHKFVEFESRNLGKEDKLIKNCILSLLKNHFKRSNLVEIA